MVSQPVCTGHQAIQHHYPSLHEHLTLAEKRAYAYRSRFPVVKTRTKHFHNHNTSLPAFIRTQLQSPRKLFTKIRPNTELGVVITAQHFHFTAEAGSPDTHVYSQGGRGELPLNLVTVCVS